MYLENEEHEENYKYLCVLMTAKVKDYYNANWDNTKSVWAHGLKGFNIQTSLPIKFSNFFSYKVSYLQDIY